MIFVVEQYWKFENFENLLRPESDMAMSGWMIKSSKNSIFERKNCMVGKCLKCKILASYALYGDFCKFFRPCREPLAAARVSLWQGRRSRGTLVLYIWGQAIAAASLSLLNVCFCCDALLFGFVGFGTFGLWIRGVASHCVLANRWASFVVVGCWLVGWQLVRACISGLSLGFGLNVVPFVLAMSSCGGSAQALVRIAFVFFIRCLFVLSLVDSGRRGGFSVDVKLRVFCVCVLWLLARYYSTS